MDPTQAESDDRHRQAAQVTGMHKHIMQSLQGVAFEHFGKGNSETKKLELEHRKKQVTLVEKRENHGPGARQQN